MSIIRISHLYRERHTARARHPAEATWYGWIAVTASRMVGAALSEPRPQEQKQHISPLPADHYNAYFTQLLCQIDPAKPPPILSEQYNQMQAGLQLVLQRLRLELSIAQVAQRTGIEPTTLLLLETGLQDPAAISQDAWLRLHTLLAADQPPVAPAADLVRLPTHKPPTPWLSSSRAWAQTLLTRRARPSIARPGRLRGLRTWTAGLQPGGRLQTQMRAALDQATKPGARTRMWAVVGRWGKPGVRLRTVLDQATKPGRLRSLCTWSAGLQPSLRPQLNALETIRRTLVDGSSLVGSPIAWLRSRLTALRSQLAQLKRQIERRSHGCRKLWHQISTIHKEIQQFVQRMNSGSAMLGSWFSLLASQKWSPPAQNWAYQPADSV
jgi:hypothetical protein